MSTHLTDPDAPVSATTNTLARRAVTITGLLPGTWEPILVAKTQVRMRRNDMFTLLFASYRDKIIITFVRPVDQNGKVIKVLTDPKHGEPYTLSCTVHWHTAPEHIARRLLAAFLPVAEPLFRRISLNSGFTSDPALLRASALNEMTEIFSLPPRNTENPEAYSFTYEYKPALPQNIVVDVKSEADITVNCRHLTLLQAKKLAAFYITIMQSEG